MFCEKCGAKTSVIESEWDDTIKVVKRKRRCFKCDINYYTAEKVYKVAKVKGKRKKKIKKKKRT